MLPQKIEDAVKFIQENEPSEGYLVAFSGGKDSIVIAKLAELAGVKNELWYNCTRIDPPQITRFIKENYPDCNWAYPKITF